MNSVWKFVLSPGLTEIKAPRHAQILTVHEQRGDICLWMQVDPENEEEIRKVVVVPTGAGFYGGKYIGSVFMENASLVFHAFEILTSN